MKVIHRITLDIGYREAEAARKRVPEGYVRIAQEVYEKTLLDYLRSHGGQSLTFDEDVRDGYITRALYWKVVNLGSRRYPYYVTEFSEIPISEVGTKKNIIYIDEGFTMKGVEYV